jgi:hypothetical protein
VSGVRNKSVSGVNMLLATGHWFLIAGLRIQIVLVLVLVLVLDADVPLSISKTS